MNIENIWKYNLRRGASDDPRNGACLFNASMWFRYGRLGEGDDDTCPIIRAYAMLLNDRMENTPRQLLKPFILRVTGNRDPEAEEARLLTIVRETTRRLLPLASRSPEFVDLASLPDDVSFEEMYPPVSLAAAKARDANEVCAYAAANHMEISITVVQTMPASAAASFAADAANATVFAADHIASVSEARRARLAVWRGAMGILHDALLIGRQASDYDEAHIHASVAAFERRRAVSAETKG